ncbi:MAG: NAD(P)/FAD-dependent oxidoreductase [Gemmatimonadota bacterium]
MTPASSSTAAVVGGGIAGLTAAYRLARAGVRVTLFEAADTFGGLGTYFEHEGHDFDKFYHVILPTDEHLLRLAGELGLADDVYWKETSLGFLYDRRIYPLAGPLDLLRFDPVPFSDRIRLGLTAIWAAHVARPGPLDDITVESWLRRLSGQRAFSRLWQPLLEAKFGDAYHDIPALWYWAAFNREKGTKKEVKGYIRGGYRAFAEGLIAAARENGADLRTGTPVHQVQLRDEGVAVVADGEELAFDKVVFCTPFAAVPELADPATLRPRLADLPLDLDHQGVINVVVMLGRSLTPHYWVPVVECGVPFRGIVETTRVLEPGDAHDRHLVYLLNYVHRSSDEFARTDEDLIEDYVAGMRSLFPDLETSDILSTHIFRTPFVEPIWTPGYSRRVPPAELVPSRVFLATTAQVYPEVTSWNTSIGLATDVSRQMTGGATER